MTLPLPKSVTDNMRFLCVEVVSQLNALLDHFAVPSTQSARRIQDRAGYSHNLKSRIHTSCSDQFADRDNDDLLRLHLRAAESVATDLERITELARNCADYLSEVSNTELLEPVGFNLIGDHLISGVNHVMEAIESRDTQLALEIGQFERVIDKEYGRLYRHYISALKSKKQTEDLTQCLFVAENLRQMGATLLHISETIVSANLGQSISFERYFSMQSLVEDFDPGEDKLSIKPLAQTRSGSAIAGVKKADSEDGYLGIFKDGIKKKVKEEREGVKNWHEIYPGLAPKILSYKKRGQSAALLIEHLPGQTFEQILLSEPQALLDEALQQLGNTLRSVWAQTQNQAPVTAGYMEQLSKRLPAVYSIHPNFQRGNVGLCKCTVLGFDALIKRAAQREKQLMPPFSVYIHGDFNVDNIIYDPLEKRINFIDLHRSRYLDYVQDVSVFMVSNYRLQILDNPHRKRILAVAENFYAMARQFARQQKDDTFDLRLALGLARSFMTSTRFILDKTLAMNMYLRSVYLLEWMLQADLEQPKKCKLPIKEIFSD